METAYNNILAKSKEKLKENEFNNDKERFNTIAKELTQWCNAIMKRLYAIETPRYVFSVSSNFGFGFGTEISGTRDFNSSSHIFPLNVQISTASHFFKIPKIFIESIIFCFMKKIF